MSTGGYIFRESGDGSVTLYSTEYSESMHTISGAWEEAFEKHIMPSGILEMDKERIQVLDVGFGLGYNVLALIHAAAERGHSPEINVLSLEKDTSIYSYMEKINFGDGRDILYADIKKAFTQGAVRGNRWSLTVKTGDARSLLPAVSGMVFDAVFHDPFSPMKNPELWTLEFFREVYSRLADDGILSTYSAASAVRTGLSMAGFFVASSPFRGMKKEGTLASKSRSERMLSNTVYAPFEAAGMAPYRDPGLCGSRSEIISRRQEEIKAFSNQSL